MAEGPAAALLVQAVGQDLRSLERATLERELRDAWGDEAVDNALSSADSLTRDDAVDRVIDLLRDALRA